MVALDLSASEIIRGDDGKTPFERNVDSISRLLATMPTDSRITIIGITKDSIADPHPLLRADISADIDYFGERLSAARESLVRAWRIRSAKLAATAQGTDIIGALSVASEIFHKEPKGSRSMLLVFSDMRNATKALNLETFPRPAPGARAAPMTADPTGLVVDLRDVVVYVVGANGGGRDIRDWQAVKQFWMHYFDQAGAQCAGYAALSAAPVLAQ